MKRLAVIMLEGFSEAYLSKRHTPFLHEVSTSNERVKLTPMFAFRGIEATIFTGLEPSQHGIWTEFKLKRSALQLSANELRNSKSVPLVDIADKLANDRLSRLARYGLRRILRRSTLHMTNLIPSRVAGFFEPALKQPIYTEHVLNHVSTLFDLMRSNDKGFTYIEPPPVGIYNPLQMLKDNIAKNPTNAFWYIKFCGHDKVGHHFGPHSVEVSDFLQEMDKKLSVFINLLNSSFPDMPVVILSAHGMSEVKGIIDLKSHLKTLDIKANRDYLTFLDSTMARFWFFNKDHEQKVTKLLKKLDHGHILTKNELMKLNVPIDQTNGHAIFAVDDGFVIHPSYFHFNRPPKGMHGYAYTTSESSYSPLIISRPNEFKLTTETKYSNVSNLFLRFLT